MSYELQKALATESYKATDLHEFVKMCRYTDQTLKNVNNKFKNIKEEFEDNDNVEREEVIVTVNSNQINQNNDKSSSRSRFETSEFESSSRAITQSLENQVNFINCYNCEKSDHFSRHCRHSRRMNSNNLVREMNVHDKKDSLNENSEFESKKE
jgi:hypothetical protein